MNKDTIYIEPSDDITDIITKVKDSKQKVVALVPPKKLGVLSSAINIKLIAKAAKSGNKAVVLVTDNPSLMKLCASVELPVAETLQSRPAVPSAEDIAAAEQGGEKMTIAETAEQAEELEAKEELAKKFTAEPESAAEIFDEAPQTEPAADLESDEIEDELAANAAKKINEEEAIEINENEEEEADSPAEETVKAVPDFKKYRKWIIAGACSLVAIVLALVWAFAIAPSANITVTVGTTSANFSENVSFTTNQADEDAPSGKFYLDPLEYKETLSAPLTATEEKNIGEKAKGVVVVQYTFKVGDKESETINIGKELVEKNNNLKYIPEKTLVTFAWPTECVAGTGTNCTVSAEVKITAAEPGEKYNVESPRWDKVIAKGAISGGTNKITKVVQQSDIDTAVKELGKLSESEAKNILTEQLGDGYMLIDSSYKVTAGEVKPSVEIGKEAGEGAKVEQEITYSIYAVDSERIAEFIRAKADLASDQKIYELGNPYIERFTTTDGAITGKIKTAYRVGPEITSDSVMEKVKGRKTGEAYSMLQSINGVRNVKLDTSFFWVNSIPDDANKIHIEIKVEQ